MDSFGINGHDSRVATAPPRCHAERTRQASGLEQERRSLGVHDFNREYLGIPMGAHCSLFTWDMWERATRVHLPLVRPGPSFGPPVEQPGIASINPFQRLKPFGELR